MRAAVSEVVARRQAALTRLAADLAAAAQALHREAGDQGTPISPPTGAVRRRLADAMAEAAGVPLIEEAVTASVRRGGRLANGMAPAALGDQGAARSRCSPALGSQGGGPAAAAHLAALDLGRLAGRGRRCGAGLRDRCIRRLPTCMGPKLPGVGGHRRRCDRAAAGCRRRSGGSGQPETALVVAAGGRAPMATAGRRRRRARLAARPVPREALALVAPEPPRVGVVPAPTLLLAAGVLGGLLLGLIAAWSTGYHRAPRGCSGSSGRRRAGGGSGQGPHC